MSVIVNDLIEQITFTLDAAEREAKATGVGTAAPWWGVEDFEPISPLVDAEDIAFIAAWSPVVVLRHVKHARDVLARHLPTDVDDDDVLCFDHREPQQWPCSDIEAVAAAWGVTS